MNAVIYTRVSTNEQVDNYSLDTQLRACQEYCAKNEIEVIKVFREEGESAKTANRPQLQAMLDYCGHNAKKIDFVIVYKVDRLARQVHDHSWIRSLLSRLDIRLRAVQETFDDTTSGQLVETMMAAIAQFDNDTRAKRAIDGMREAVSQGQWVWQPPIGYMRPAEPRSGPSLIPDPKAAPLVRLAFERIAAGGKTKLEVRAEVTALGLRARSGKTLTPQSFGNMLRNPLYMGRIVVPKWSYQGSGDFEPIVDPSLFAQVQEMHRDKRPGKSNHKKDSPDFPLRRFIRCGHCDSPLTGSWSRGRNTRYPYYHCPKGKCPGMNVRKERLESLFLEQLQTLEVRTEVFDLLDAITRDVWCERTTVARKEHHVLSAKLQQVKTHKDRLVDAYVQEAKIDQATYEEQSARLDHEREELRQAIARTHVDDFQLDDALRFARTLLTDVAGCWNRLSHQQRPAFQSAIFPNGLTYAGGKVGTTQKSWLFPTFVPQIGTDENLAVPALHNTNREVLVSGPTIQLKRGD